VIGRPPAAAAVVPAGDLCIRPGSKGNGIVHCALLAFEWCGCVHVFAWRRAQGAFVSP
jgi:hypothetical protein